MRRGRELGNVYFAALLVVTYNNLKLKWHTIIFITYTDKPLRSVRAQLRGISGGFPYTVDN